MITRTMRKFFAITLFIIWVAHLCALSPSFAAVRAEKNTYYIDDAEGSAPIRNGNKKQARQEAQRAAYKDAIDKAMNIFAGEVNADMRNRVFAKSQSMVKNFRITNEIESGDTLYITGSCTIGERAFDGVLGPEVISMLGNPRVMIIVDEESSGNNASTVENELLQLFEKAGFEIVDKDQAQTLLALDPKKAFSDPEMLAGAAKTTKADIIIVARAQSGAQSTSRLGIKMYKPSASVQVKAVLTKTASQISSSTISRGTSNWQGSASAAGMIRSGLRQAADEIIYKIAYKMASGGSLGGITVNIQLANASFKDKQRLTEFLREEGQVFERGYSRQLTELDIVSPKNAESVAALISDYSLPDGVIEIEGQTAQTVAARVIPKAPVQREDPKPTQYIVINIYLEKLTRDEANDLRDELQNFIGSAGEIQGNFNSSPLNIEVKIAEGSEGTKNVMTIASFLKNDIKATKLTIDNPDGNSIKGRKSDGGMLDGIIPGSSWW